MMQTLPKIIPVNELKNTSSIMKICKDSKVPVVITKNGYGEAVMMSIELYEKIFAEIQAASLINEGIFEIENNSKPVDGNEFFSQMKEKYGK